jgi:hypothetical protein
MDIPTPPQAVIALAAFLRERLGDRAEVGPAGEHSVVAAARQLAAVIVGAAAPFAPTSYSRARLIRQMHASGLLTGDEVRRTVAILDQDGDAYGAPR